MNVKEVIEQLINYPMDTKIKFCSKENEGFQISKIIYSNIPNIVWFDEDD